jgi:two-component system sensor histidine kinase PilS (NtrC family)
MGSGAERDEGLRGKVAVLIGARAIAGTFLLGGAIAVQWAAPESSQVAPFFILIALTYALTLLFAATIGAVERQPWLVTLQFAADALLVTSFIALTGGITSVFAVLYVLPVVAASLIRYRRGGLAVATLSGAMYVLLVLAQYGVVPLVSWHSGDLSLPSGSAARYIAALNASGFLGVAYLTGSLAEHARAASARLQQASSEIADLQAMNQHVIDSLPSGLLTTDSLQRVVGFNHAAETICGLAFQHVLGRQVAEVLQLPPHLVEMLDEGLSGGAARRIEFRYKRADGKPIDLGLSATHLETPGGRAGFLINFQDLTDIKRLEHEARLQQRLAAVGEMAAGIAHEIRNPLASMSGSIQILRQELALSAEQDQLMDIVLRESERLNTTIRSFLAYARPQRFAIVKFDVRRTINDAALLLRNSAEVQDGHTVDVVVPEAPVWCEADEGQIKQIVWNLATNGLRAMAGGGRLTLAAETRNDGNVTLTVADEGVGIPADEIDGMFQPFRGHFSKGSGLGLSIVHRIVSDYRGRIDVRSRPGEGTSVAVSLPASAEVAA